MNMSEKQNSPVISIIIPVYNKSLYLTKCLDSILAQTFKAFECILVDDGSTDKSREICRNYSSRDNRIKTFLQENKGPSAARNRALQEVHSPWVTFVDADDYVTPQYLENYIKHLHNDITVQVVQGYHCFGYAGEEKDTLYPGTSYSYQKIREGESAIYIDKNNLLINWAVWCKIFSLEIIRNNNLQFEESLKCGEDGLFWHKYMCFIKEIIFIPERGYVYFCPRKFSSISRGAAPISVDGAISLASNYNEISKILPAKFKLGHKSTLFLQMLYLNNYFRTLWKNPCFTQDQWKKLQSVRPPKMFFISSKRWIFYFIGNLLPLWIFRLCKKIK